MAHDVFISYSSDDKSVADAVCATLENRKVRCWMAPRDVLPGVPYAEALIDALNQSKILLLVFSAKSNQSPQVMREVERAVNKGIPILPFRIEDVKPSKSMEYFLSAPHWLDAMTPPLEKHLQRLADSVQMLLEPESGEKRKGTPTDKPVVNLPEPAPPSRRSHRNLVIASIAALIVVGIATAIILSARGAKEPTSPPATTLPGRTSTSATNSAPVPGSVLPSSAAGRSLSLAASLAKTKIVFVSYNAGPGSIYIMSPDGSGQVRLTNNNTNNGFASWSPDGSKIVYISNQSGTHQLYSMNPDGSAQTQIFSQPIIGPISWSPDGAKIVFSSSSDGNDEIYVANVDGTNLVRLTLNPASDTEPVWSPDGSKIAFDSNRDGVAKNAVYIMNSDGTGQTRLVSTGSVSGHPSWSPDGSKIAFNSNLNSNRDPTPQIHAINVNGSNEIQLTTGASMNMYTTWSPDSANLVFISWRDGNGDICVMNSDGSGQTRLTHNMRCDDSPPSWSPYLK